ncbi:hypothetical protein MYCTH_2130172 [Thermothelomyces thermophilus ATCC 42464]|uniref:Uncharacterized protein n=1 Tax=Thermothelomyces thermophilus (strain ATCC 42464 / BCRC 31852 / DSM 1799) TaxID=573729 RepID=G2QM49_THET4|nr:uncharacterized protein MYCTH_2130172 [Thermothelomyces thermophilus ATCC 42464]AEO61029.1 hypothetical protein MYCTH_2130172 [Thermothelomyces thermophilus ATCC 42464]
MLDGLRSPWVSTGGRPWPVLLLDHRLDFPPVLVGFVVRVVLGPQPVAEPEVELLGGIERPEAGPRPGDTLRASRREPPTQLLDPAFRGWRKRSELLEHGNRSCRKMPSRSSSDNVFYALERDTPRIRSMTMIALFLWTKAQCTRGDGNGCLAGRESHGCGLYEVCKRPDLDDRIPGDRGRKSRSNYP